METDAPLSNHGHAWPTTKDGDMVVTCHVLFDELDLLPDLHVLLLPETFAREG
jgi:hypothetical protein